MDESTEGVTLYAGFIFDIVDLYKNSTFAAPLLEMTKDLDPSQPTAPVPMQLYNDVCSWVEDKLGEGNLRKAGGAIGRRAYRQMVAQGGLGSNPTPLDILTQLKQVASFMIQDPKDRQWEILDVEDRSLRMRRTQTFNCILQEGLLRSLVLETGVTAPTVEHVTCTRRGDEFCEYVVRWV